MALNYWDILTTLIMAVLVLGVCGVLIGAVADHFCSADHKSIDKTHK